MKIWWCQEHKMAAAEPESEEPNDCPAIFLGWMHGKPCRLVPMRLIPDDAETIERIADVIYASGWGLRSDARERAVKVLAALDGETP